MDGAIGAKTVTYDFHRLMEGATLVSCSGFAKEIVRHMWTTQRGYSGARPGFGEEDLLPTSSGYTIPRRAMELLAPHRKTPLVA